MLLAKFSEIFPAISALVILFFAAMAATHDDPVSRVIVGLLMIPTFATAVVLAPRREMNAIRLLLASLLWPVTIGLWLTREPS